MPVIITTGRHCDQRYNTVGDYFYDLDDTHTYIRVSDCGNPDYEFLIALHEFVEAYLAKRAKIPEEVITEFDRKCPDGEPGANSAAPYHKGHLIASMVEKLVANVLGIDWEQYEQALDNILKGESA